MPRSYLTGSIAIGSCIKSIRACLCIWINPKKPNKIEWITSNMNREECSSCLAIYINGVYCHEFGCPEAWKDRLRDCIECGHTFLPNRKNQDICNACNDTNED